jgi:tetratricopeptide (TPR) repeat protein
MPSIIEGYNYDIFISYRQKDNKGDRWVSEFVEALKTELESTFKEEISVYFDINPHDGLLETHDVDASLKDKLKCLVFIPIISRTYCDPKSFAWEHEFKAFVKQASKDQFGLKVKLSGGNVANRVLPVQIHDLDVEDRKLVESELGGFLRGIEFIYKEPGVNKPLTSGDDEKRNLNNTKYRLQINKVGNAIKEIISKLKTEPIELGKEVVQHREPLEEVKKEEKKDDQEKPAKKTKRKVLIGGIILASIFVLAILAYPKIFKRNTLEKLRSSGERISVVVMPFQNMTNDTIWNVWQNGIQDMMINYLSNFPEELKVRQREFINGLLQDKGFTDYASLTPAAAGSIAQKLDANIFILGSIKQAGNKIRLNTQITDSKTKETLYSSEIEGPSNEKEIFHIIDSANQKVKDFLIISKLGKDLFIMLNVGTESSRDFQQDAKSYGGSASSPEAYRYYIYGINAMLKGDYNTAMNMFSQSVAADSNFIESNLSLAGLQFFFGMVEQGKELIKRIYKQKDRLPLKGRISLDIYYSSIFEPPQEQLKYHKQLLAIDDQDPGTYITIGAYYFQFLQFDKAIPEYEKAFEIYNKWDSKPFFVLYSTLGKAYHETGDYKKEINLYKKAENEIPDIDIRTSPFGELSFDYRQAVLSLTLGKDKAANKYIEKYIKFKKENSATEAEIKASLAQIYRDADKFDKAEDYFRQALSLEPENPERMENLAYFLIDKDININEGLELSNKSLGISPDNDRYLDTKGWGLYKQGKYEESLEVFNKCLALTPPLSGYIHYVHIEEVKKAVAGQKRTDR